MSSLNVKIDNFGYYLEVDRDTAASALTRFSVGVLYLANKVSLVDLILIRLFMKFKNDYLCLNRLPGAVYADYEFPINLSIRENAALIKARYRCYLELVGSFLDNCGLLSCCKSYNLLAHLSDNFEASIENLSLVQKFLLFVKKNIHLPID